MKPLHLSPLPKTWLLDIDGTLVVHNGYLDGGETLLEGVSEFFTRIGPDDKVILLTSRGPECKEPLEQFLRRNRIRYDHIVYALPLGERILVNDEKPSGLKTAYAVSKTRDVPLDVPFVIDGGL